VRLEYSDWQLLRQTQIQRTKTEVAASQGRWPRPGGRVLKADGPTGRPSGQTRVLNPAAHGQAPWSLHSPERAAGKLAQSRGGTPPSCCTGSRVPSGVQARVDASQALSKTARRSSRAYYTVTQIQITYFTSVYQTQTSPLTLTEL